MVYALRPWTSRARGSIASGVRLYIEPWLSLTSDLGRAAVEGALDGGVGLAVHEPDRLRHSRCHRDPSALAWLMPAMPSMSTEM